MHVCIICTYILYTYKIYIYTCNTKLGVNDFEGLFRHEWFFGSVNMKIDGPSLKDKWACLKIPLSRMEIPKTYNLHCFPGEGEWKDLFSAIRLVHRSEHPVMCLCPWRRYKLGRNLRSLIPPPLLTSIQGNYECENEVIQQDIWPLIRPFIFTTLFYPLGLIGRVTVVSSLSCWAV